MHYGGTACTAEFAANAGLSGPGGAGPRCVQCARPFRPVPVTTPAAADGESKAYSWANITCVPVLVGEPPAFAEALPEGACPVTQGGVVGPPERARLRPVPVRTVCTRPRGRKGVPPVVDGSRRKGRKERGSVL